MAYKRGRGMTLSDLYCEKCGLKMTVPRQRGNTREKGHLKTMYCVICKVETQFLEVRQRDYTIENARGDKE